MDTGKRECPEGSQTPPIIFEGGRSVWDKSERELLQSLRSPAVPRLPECDLSRYKNPPKCTPAEAWRNCAEAIERYDADTCKAYREEIDTLLVFAGLFSAVLTAFTIESYQWLQDDPNDAIIALLSQLVQAQGSTHSAPSPSGLPDVVSVRINAYWFLSLILSLSSALIAILCKQWVREFERHAGQSHEQYISIRQMKLEGFEGWGVATVVTVIPLLLQSALALFALGLIQLLWNLHMTVAIVAIIPSITVFLFYGATSLLPALQLIFRPLAMCRTVTQCPYKSPQSMLVLRALLVMVKHTHSWYSASIRLVTAVYSSLRIRVPAPLRRRIKGIFLRWKSSVASSGLARRFRRQRSISPIPMTTDLAPSMMLARCQWWAKFWSLLIQDGEGITVKANQPLSWIALDADVLRMRDLLYSDTEYLVDDSSGSNSVPPRAYFRALLWLRTYIDQPGLPLWVWLTAWETVVKPGSHRSHSISPLHAYHGIRHLLSGTAKGRLDDARNSPAFPNSDHAISAAIVYATDLNFDATFIAELVIRHLLGLWDSLKGYHLSNIVEMLGRGLDTETNHSLLHAVLSLSLYPVGHSSQFGCLLTKTSIAVSSMISQPEIACVIVTYLRRVYPGTTWIRADRTDNDLDNLLQLFYVMADCLERDSTGCLYDPSTVQSAAVINTFRSLALELHDYFTHLKGEPEIAGQLAFGLSRQPYQRTYLGLLSNVLPAHLADSILDWYLEPLADWYSAVLLSRETDVQRLMEARLKAYANPIPAFREKRARAALEERARAAREKRARAAREKRARAAREKRARAWTVPSVDEILAQYSGLWPGYPFTIGQSGSDVEPGNTGPTVLDDYPGPPGPTPTGRDRRGEIMEIMAEYPALWSAYSGFDTQSASDVEPGPAGSMARDHGDLSLLAPPPDSPGADQEAPHEAEEWIAFSSVFDNDATIPDTMTWAAARCTGYSRTVNQSTSDVEPGTSGWAAHEYDEISLIATPERHGVEVDPLHDAEPETTFSPASGGHDTGSQSSPEHENLVTAALASYDAERSTTISTMDDGETTNSQSNEVDEAFLAAARSLSTTEELPVSPAKRNASTLLPENPSNAVPVAGRDTSLATAVAVPASGTDVSSAWTNQEPYDHGAAAVVPQNMAAGVRLSAEHGDEELSSLVTGPAGGGLDPCAASFAVSATERGTEITIKTGGELSTGAQTLGSELDSEPRHQ